MKMRLLFFGFFLFNTVAFASTFLEELEKMDIKTFPEMIRLSGLEDEIENGPRKVIIVPTELAFDDPEESIATLVQDQEALDNALKYHLVSKVETLEKSFEKGQMKTDAGRIIKLSKNIAGIFMNKEIVVYRNIKVNGHLVHIVDKLLSPEEDTPYNELQPVVLMDKEELPKKDWYLVAEIGDTLQKCHKQKNTFERDKKGAVKIWKSYCFQEDGKSRKSKSKLLFDENSDNAYFKAKSGLFGLSTKSYVFIQLGADYHYIVFADLKRKSLQVLSTEPSISKESFETIKFKAKINGFNPEQIKLAPDFTVEDTAPTPVPQSENPEN